MKSKDFLLKIVYHIGLFFAGINVKIKYNYKHSKRLHLKEPTLILGNHTTESDMIMLAMNFYEHMYIVCGEHLFRSKMGPFINKMFKPIPASKGGSHLAMVKVLSKKLRAGNNVMLFPEGSRSFNGITEEVNDSIGKLVKMSKCALATFHTEGGYFIAPRWAYHFRKGPVRGEVRHLISSEELSHMSAEEITALINKDLYEDAHETQRMKPKKYKGKGLAEGIENYLVICPKCGAYDSFSSENDAFKCDNCGLNGTYGEDGFLHGDLPFDAVSDWGKWMTDRFTSDMSPKADDELLFTETDVRLYSIDDKEHTSTDIVSSGTLYVYKNRMTIDSHTFLFSEISEAAMLYFGKSLLFTCPEGYLALTGEHFHAWKEAMLYRIYINTYMPDKKLNVM